MQINNNNPNILSDSIALFSHKGTFNIKTNNDIIDRLEEIEQEINALKQYLK